MSADVEKKILVAHGATDAAHVDGILLEHGHRWHLLGQAIRGGEARRAGPNDERFEVGWHHSNNCLSIRAATRWSSAARRRTGGGHCMRRARLPRHRRGLRPAALPLMRSKQEWRISRSWWSAPPRSLRHSE